MTVERPITVQVSGTLFDRVADSLESDLGRRFGRFAQGEWDARKVGKGYRYTIDASIEEATYIAQYFGTLAGLRGAGGMDPEGARDTRIEGNAAARSAAEIRRQLQEVTR
jgi:hypothetical protein